MARTVAQLVEDARQAGFDSQALKRLQEEAREANVEEEFFEKVVKAAGEEGYEIETYKLSAAEGGTPRTPSESGDRVTEWLQDIPVAGTGLAKAREHLKFLQSTPNDTPAEKVFKIAGKGTVIVFTGLSGAVVVVDERPKNT